MINFNLLSLGNRILVKSEVLGFGTKDLRECIVTGLGEELVEVQYPGTGAEYMCKPNQVESIPLTDMLITNLGFTKRNMKDPSGNVIDDMTLCNTVDSSLWFILSLRKTKENTYFLDVKECNETIGTGFVKTLHQFQNQVKFITDDRCKI